jgi:hypothetical protein
MTTLFDLVQYDLILTKREIDPYWDELVLDCSGRVEDNEQTTLFYDVSDEPPDPDDFQDHIDFEVAWSDWEKQHPDFKPAMSSWIEQDDGDFIDVLGDLPILRYIEQNINTFDNLPEQNNSVLEDLSSTLPEQNINTFDNLPEQNNCVLEDLSSTLPEQNINTFDNLPEQNNSVLEDLSSTLPEQNINFDNLPEQNNCVLEKSKQLAQWTEKYSVNRGSKRHWYFRYCYYWSGKIHHIHIPGGNTNSAIALERVERVKSAITNAASPTEIQNLIRGGFQN